MSEEINTRGKNKSFYHYYVNEVTENGWSDPIFFRTLQEVKDRYNISRATVYRLLTDPQATTRFAHKITKQYIHETAIQFIQNNQEALETN